MTDIFTKEKRSKIMGLVKSKNTKPEILLRKKLHQLGFRFRVHQKDLPGTPDIKLTRYKTVIFVNGCFWHGHIGCKHYTVPKTNKAFWIEKIATNQENDNSNYQKLRQLGWKVIVVWTCQLTRKMIDVAIAEIINDITSA